MFIVYILLYILYIIYIYIYIILLLILLIYIFLCQKVKRPPVPPAGGLFCFSLLPAVGFWTQWGFYLPSGSASQIGCTPRRRVEILLPTRLYQTGIKVAVNPLRRLLTGICAYRLPVRHAVPVAYDAFLAGSGLSYHHGNSSSTSILLVVPVLGQVR